jgi:hypothetical protein
MPEISASAIGKRIAEGILHDGVALAAAAVPIGGVEGDGVRVLVPGGGIPLRNCAESVAVDARSGDHLGAGAEVEAGAATDDSMAGWLPRESQPWAEVLEFVAKGDRLPLLA